MILRRVGWCVLALMILAVAMAVTFTACDDDDDDDDNDVAADDDTDSGGAGDCTDAAHVAAEASCAELGLTAQASAGLDYSIAECGVICTEYYYDYECKDGYCVCCI